MGKQKHIKLIRKLAESLPPMTGQKMQGMTVTGGELIENGIEKLKDGSPVIIGQLYKYGEQVAVTVQINHERQMKRLYDNGGMPAVVAYAEQVKKMFDVHKNQSLIDQLTTEPIS